MVRGGVCHLQVFLQHLQELMVLPQNWGSCGSGLAKAREQLLEVVEEREALMVGSGCLIHPPSFLHPFPGKQKGICTGTPCEFGGDFLCPPPEWGAPFKSGVEKGRGVLRRAPWWADLS